MTIKSSTIVVADSAEQEHRGNPQMTSTILKPVFFPAVAIIAVLVVYAVIVPDAAGVYFNAAKDWVAGTFGWLY